MNNVHLCGHNALRVHVMGYENRPPTKEEMCRMKDLLDEALKNGAGGMSSGLYYLPGSFAKTEEVCELASLLKGTGKPYATHIRSESDYLLEAIEEAITIAKAGDGNLEISHLKTSGPKNWGKIDAVFGLIDFQLAVGLDEITRVGPQSGMVGRDHYIPGFPGKTGQPFHLFPPRCGVFTGMGVASRKDDDIPMILLHEGAERLYSLVKDTGHSTLFAQI